MRRGLTLGFCTLYAIHYTHVYKHLQRAEKEERGKRKQERRKEKGEKRNVPQSLSSSYATNGQKPQVFLVVVSNAGEDMPTFEDGCGVYARISACRRTCAAVLHSGIRLVVHAMRRDGLRSRSERGWMAFQIPLKGNDVFPFIFFPLGVARVPPFFCGTTLRGYLTDIPLFFHSRLSVGHAFRLVGLIPTESKPFSFTLHSQHVHAESDASNVTLRILALGGRWTRILTLQKPTRTRRAGHPVWLA
jgi:hypothetical protein